MMTEEIHKIDIRGQVCPSSLLLALREVNSMADALNKGSKQVVVLTDNRDATGTIPETVRNMGYRASVEKKNGYYRILIEANDGSVTVPYR